VACGSDSNSSNTQQFPLNDAVSAYMQIQHSYTVQWTDQGDSYTAQVEMQPGAQQSFQGTTAYTTAVTTTTRKNGAPYSTDNVTDYFLLGPYENLGAHDNTGGNWSFVIKHSPFPDIAKIGQAGVVDNEVTVLGTAPNTGFLTGYDNSWILQPGGNSDQAKLCEVSAIQPEAGMPQTVESCYTIDSEGNVLGATVTPLTFVMSAGFN
jgi:hypothetical protein